MTNVSSVERNAEARHEHGIESLCARRFELLRSLEADIPAALFDAIRDKLVYEREYFCAAPPQRPAAERRVLDPRHFALQPLEMLI